ncbi:MAG: hypothetical protein JJ896_07235 [Rhodothermales bacterium]|nr:hypothetical protein [Rhodothermales bacterium]MBO6779431.1 hypothetical protein [Rhodothermales bacterium]
MVNEVESRFLATPEKGEVSALLLTAETPRALLVLGHGAGAGMRHKNLQAVSEELAARGISTFRYQFPFRERGGGRDSEAVSLATVRSAVREARRLYPALPLFAGGHSFGGRMTSLAAAKRGGAEDPMNTLSGMVYFNFPLHAPGRASDHRAAHLGDVVLPQLFLSGTRDSLAKLELLEPVVARTKDATLHKLDTADHGFKVLKRTRTSPESAIEEACRIAAAWMEGLVPG